MACVTACPFGNMHADEMGKAVVKCDLCKGAPKCALFCPTKTLEYLPIK
jgi:Fe-S-cluster-containing hydrogenase component 2